MPIHRLPQPRVRGTREVIVRDDGAANDEGWPTARRHPRSLADAFPDVRASAIEPHIAPPMWKRIELFFRRRFA